MPVFTQSTRDTICQRWLAIALGVGLAFTTAGRTAVTVAADEKTPEAAGRESATAALERVTYRDETGAERTVSGRVLVEAIDGGLLVQGQDGWLWTIEKERLSARQATGAPFVSLAPDALGRRIAAELGADCEVVSTKHYVICTRAGRAYAQWCGALFERLYAAFHNYWKQRGIALREPEFPLVAMIFANDRQFAAFATKDAGPGLADAKGYFSIKTNRIALFDLTASGAGAARNAADITRRLAAAPYNIATVIHEATHQIAFNSGMHTRYADNPLWLTEGMAMFFETPDLSSQSGWKTVGAVNDLRSNQFRAFLANRPPDSLATLLRSDARFTDPKQMGDAYAEAWALSYFLIKVHKEAYVEYLSRVAAKPRLVWDDPERRLAEFRAAFGDDLQQLDAEFVKYVRRQQ